MVLLTMTAAIVEALETYPDIATEVSQIIPSLDKSHRNPSLSPLMIGNPISHAQILSLSRCLKTAGISTYHLDSLLLGSKVYTPPPPPKPEQTPEYKALMARLRAEEESRVYERMINAPPTFIETFQQRAPGTNSAAIAFSSTSDYIPSHDLPSTDEATFADINRQMALIINVLVSVVCCSAALWMVARWWSTPARLALSLGGSLVVAVAECAIYWGYVYRVQSAKEKEKGVKEIKEVVSTWEVGGDNGDTKVTVLKLLTTANEDLPKGVRKRRKEDKA